MTRLPPSSTLFPYTTLFRSCVHLLDDQLGRIGLGETGRRAQHVEHGQIWNGAAIGQAPALEPRDHARVDAPAQLQEIGKSTRLNSSHSQISYAVFCLLKKKS